LLGHLIMPKVSSLIIARSAEEIYKNVYKIKRKILGYMFEFMDIGRKKK